jgi:putative ATPase
MRPRELGEVVGQTHLLGPGKIIAGLSPTSHVPSLLLCGPPGIGKTTLARLIGAAIRAHVIALSAVDCGVKDVRQAAADAAARRDQYGTRTVLFIDEIHRFSRAQQDALLPHVESGTVLLIGATTENPSFGVIAALLSRCRVLRLEPLASDELQALARRALEDLDRGLGALSMTLAPEALEQLIEVSGGDARRMFNALEIAAHLAKAAGQSAISPAQVIEAAQQRTLHYDRAGDEHYGVVSAFIKSLRGSDPDAAVYWLTRMLEAGEDLRFVLRRMVIFASEDVGNADPQALAVAVAAMQSAEFIGLPEAVLPLTQAVIYLSLAPKSNTALTTFARARALVREHGALPVPARLLNAVSAHDRARGHGRDYKYPHEFDGAYVPEEYLPERLIGTALYEPTSSGYEEVLRKRHEALGLLKGKSGE